LRGLAAGGEHGGAEGQGQGRQSFGHRPDKASWSIEMFNENSCFSIAGRARRR
jgi:hypothetical protein